MGDIENTAKRPAEAHLVGLIGSDTYVPDMEAEGQHQLVNSSRMPAGGDWGTLEALGFTKGDPVSGDPLFVEATLPRAWKKQGTDHAMHTDVVDERGLPRVDVFYKAAFYDRRASFDVMDVGACVVSPVISGGDGSVVALPQEWPLLTEIERAGALSHVERVVARKFYGADEPESVRANELLQLLKGELEQD